MILIFKACNQESLCVFTRYWTTVQQNTNAVCLDKALLTSVAFVYTCNGKDCIPELEGLRGQILG